MRLELRTRDGGRVLNAAQPPPERDFDLPNQAAETPAGVPSVSVLPATAVAMEIGAATVVLDLGFAPSADERRVLESSRATE